MSDTEKKRMTGIDLGEAERIAAEILTITEDEIFGTAEADELSAGSARTEFPHEYRENIPGDLPAPPGLNFSENRWNSGTINSESSEDIEDPGIIEFLEKKSATPGNDNPEENGFFETVEIEINDSGIAENSDEKTESAESKAAGSAGEADDFIELSDYDKIELSESPSRSATSGNESMPQRSGGKALTEQERNNIPVIYDEGVIFINSGEELYVENNWDYALQRISTGLKLPEEKSEKIIAGEDNNSLRPPVVFGRIFDELEDTAPPNEYEIFYDNELDFIENAVLEEDFQRYINEIDNYHTVEDLVRISSAVELFGLTKGEIIEIADQVFLDEKYQARIFNTYDLLKPDTGLDGKPVSRSVISKYLMKANESLSEFEKESIEEELTSNYALIIEEDVSALKRKLSESYRYRNISDIIYTVQDISDKLQFKV